MALPTEQQYFGSTTLGGTISFTDYCPVFVGGGADQQQCTSSYADSALYEATGDEHGTSSRCFASNLSATMPNGGTNYAYCYPTSCTYDAASGAPTLSISVKGVALTCPQGGGDLSADAAGLFGRYIRAHDQQMHLTQITSSSLRTVQLIKSLVR